MKPIRMRGEPSPAKQEIVCTQCGSNMGSIDPDKDKVTSTTCPSCGQPNAGKIIGLHDRKPDDKGKQYNPYSLNNLIFTNPNQRLAQVNEELKFNLRNRKNNKKIVDNPIVINNIDQSCVDLAIDG